MLRANRVGGRLRAQFHPGRLTIGPLFGGFSIDILRDADLDSGGANGVRGDGGMGLAIGIGGAIRGFNEVPSAIYNCPGQLLVGYHVVILIVDGGCQLMLSANRVRGRLRAQLHPSRLTSVDCQISGIADSLICAGHCPGPGFLGVIDVMGIPPATSLRFYIEAGPGSDIPAIATDIIGRGGKGYALPSIDSGAIGRDHYMVHSPFIAYGDTMEHRGFVGIATKVSLVLNPLVAIMDEVNGLPAVVCIEV
ncbi:hypothetical protein ES703_95644 [subsurface metagenome]